MKIKHFFAVIWVLGWETPAWGGRGGGRSSAGKGQQVALLLQEPPRPGPTGAAPAPGQSGNGKTGETGSPGLPIARTKRERGKRRIPQAGGKGISLERKGGFPSRGKKGGSPRLAKKGIPQPGEMEHFPGCRLHWFTQKKGQRVFPRTCFSGC